MKWFILASLWSLQSLAHDLPFFTETIYGDDDRMSISHLDPALSSGVVVGIAYRYARQNPSITAPTLEQRYRVCADEKFSQEPTIADCTGMHVGGGIVLTAKHCVPNSYGCERLSWAFNYTDQHLTGETLSLPALFQCEDILASDEILDAVLIRLKNAKRLPKIKIHFNEIAPEQVFAIGSPLGLALKHSGLGPSQQVSSTHLVAAIDVFRGNSGSPVFTRDQQLIGMLTSGGRDFINTTQGCLRNYVAALDSPLERILLLDALPEKMKKIIQRAQRSR